MATPTVKRRQLGNELRHLRKLAEMDVESAGEIIERSQPVMSRLERGETGIRQNDLRLLLDFYSKQLGEKLDVDWYTELNRGAGQRGRWTGYRSIYKKYFRMAVDLEADATDIRIYQTEIVHGLLQTEDYMRALFTSNQLRAVDQSVKHSIRARLERQDVLTKPDAPVVTIVLSESGLRRKVGNAKVMRAQLAHLAELAKQPNLHLHVSPFETPTSAGVSFPFMQYRVPAASDEAPPLEFVFIETYTNGEYLDGPQHVATYNHVWSGLLGAALNEVDTRDFLLQVAQWYQ